MARRMWTLKEINAETRRKLVEIMTGKVVGDNGVNVDVSEDGTQLVISLDQDATLYRHKASATVSGEILHLTVLSRDPEEATTFSELVSGRVIPEGNVIPCIYDGPAMIWDDNGVYAIYNVGGGDPVSVGDALTLSEDIVEPWFPVHEGE